jgi:hypothetical protein
MFCARCGQQIPNATEICPLCGREASLRLVPQPATDFLLASKTVLPLSVASQGPNGIGGWLLFYCLTLTLLSPAYLLLYFSMMPYRIVTIYLFIGILRGFLGIVVGIFLWMRRPVALFLLKVYFIYIAAGLSLTALETVRAIIRTKSSTLAGSGFALLVSTGITILWFLYFRRSVRVKNTYGANL